MWLQSLTNICPQYFIRISNYCPNKWWKDNIKWPMDLFIWFTPGEYIIKWQFKKRNNWSKCICNEHVPNIANSRTIAENMIPKISIAKFSFQWTITMIAKVSFFCILNEISFKLIYQWWFIIPECQSKNANQRTPINYLSSSIIPFDLWQKR